jgi:hypothetical protein
LAESAARTLDDYLKPLLEQTMRQFPFRIQGFHTD